MNSSKTCVTEMFSIYQTKYTRQRKYQLEICDTEQETKVPPSSESIYGTFIPHQCSFHQVQSKSLAK